MSIYSLSQNEDIGCMFRSINSSKIRIIWELTGDCNLDCSHCFKSIATNNQLSINKILKTIEEFDEKIIGKVMLTGGEPLLLPEINTIINSLLNKNILTKVISNLTFSYKVLENIENIKNIEISTSLDGHNEYYHDKIRGKGSFKQLKNNLLFCLENNIKINIICVVSKHNVDYIEDIIKIALLYGVKTITFSKLINIEIDKTKNIIDFFNDKQLNNNDINIFLNKVKILRLKYDNCNIRTVGFVNDDICHAAGKTLIYITPEGKLHPCTLLRIKNEELDINTLTFNDAIKHISNNEYLMESFCPYVH